MLVINYHGSLRSYAVDRDNAFTLQHSFLFNTQYPLGVSSVVYHPGADLLVVGGCSSEGDTSPSPAAREGLSLWRVLSSAPHYKLVTDYEFDLHQVLLNSHDYELSSVCVLQSTWTLNNIRNYCYQFFSEQLIFICFIRQYDF